MDQLSWRLCEWCGALYTPARPTTRTCSAECRLLHNRRKQSAKRYVVAQTRPCAYCGEPMTTKWSTRRTCSKYCRHRLSYAHEPVWHEKTCIQCGAPFVSKRSDADHCGKACGQRAAYERNRADRIAAAARWSAEHREERRAIAMTYKVRRRGWVSAGPGVSPADWTRLVDRHRGRCAYCETLAPLHMEHVVPLSRGGQHAIGNVLPACGPCNTSKGASLLVEWRRRLALAAA